MAKRKRESPKITFLGSNSDNVTGSIILVETTSHKILLEAGLFQSNNIKNDYKINSRRFKFKPKEIDFIFINHFHIDHLGILPKLYKDGCNANIFIPNNSYKISKILLEDSAHINGKDAISLSKMLNKPVYPIYEKDHVEMALEFFDECPFNKIIKVNNEISFRFIPSGHIINSAQLELYITQNNKTYSLLYTSDLGNTRLNKPFIKPFKSVQDSFDIVIGESTYARKSDCKIDINKDIEKLKETVIQTCINKRSKLLIPCFALDRTQYIVKLLYDLFGNDKNFNIPIYIDSPMACNITKTYGEILEGKDLELYNKVFSWKNLHLISEYQDSKAILSCEKPKIILSSSGMMTAGRVIAHAIDILPNHKACILFCGYSAEGSLASIIKNSIRSKSRIKINNKKHIRNCSVVTLNSFSSHMQRTDLLEYYSKINTNGVYLVHSNFNDKCEFCKDLKLEMENKCKTTKVVAVHKDLEVSL